MTYIFILLVARLPDFMTNLAEGSRMVPSLEFNSAIFSSGKHILELSCPAWAKINAEEPCMWKKLYELESYFSEHLLLNIPTAIVDMD